MKPQIYDATTELDDKIRLRVFVPGPETFRNHSEVSQEIPEEIPQENSEKHPDNMFKVITHSKNESRDAEFDGAGYQDVGLG